MLSDKKSATFCLTKIPSLSTYLKYAADPNPHTDSPTTHTSLLTVSDVIGTKRVDQFLTSDPVVSLANKSNLLHFYAWYACGFCYK